MNATATPYPGQVSLRLFDTATREQRDFVPLRAGAASMYVCGATVQGLPHIGHVRSGLNYDVLRRWLTHGGYDVTLVRNVTDIDDKILRKAADAGRPWWEWAATHERAFAAAYDALGCLPASIEPRATGHVPQMIDLMERLVDSDHAYAAGGDVYFSVRSFPDYGALSHQKVDDVAQGEGESGAKRDPLDFTLWKAAKPGEPSWATPWGRGRPGWHLECSAMSTFYLGPEFDIHGGGLDLVFPHHENERAQSNAAGDGFARYWLHNAWVTMGGEKMSKSLGNTLAIDVLLRRVRGVELRYYLVGPHYRSSIEYSDAALQESVAAYRRIESFVHRVRERVGTPRAGHGVARVRRGDGRRPGHAGRARRHPRRRPRGQHRARQRRSHGGRLGRRGVGARDDGRAGARPPRPALGRGRGRVRRRHRGAHRARRGPPRPAPGGALPARLRHR